MALDPMTAALLNAGSNVLGKAVESKPAGPSNALASSMFSSGFDSSGWNVNFGSGTIESARSQETASAQGEVIKWIPIAAAAVGVVLLWRFLKK